METVPPLRAGALTALATFGFAAVVGLIAVIDADDVASAVALGVAVAVVVFAAGATVACALSCLVRGRLEWVSVAVIAVAGLAVDLLVLGVWRDIDSEAYGKVTAIGLAWTLFALLALGLTIAVGEVGAMSRPLYLAALVSIVAAAAIATWLIAKSGAEGITVFDSPVGLIGDDGLLRALGAALVLTATLWFGALAASRLDRASITR
jgi:hypothetical protein